MAKVRKVDGGVRVTLVGHEVGVLTQLLDGLDQMLITDLVSESPASTMPQVSEDPLVALTGIGGSSGSASGQTTVPEDLAIRRLVPDAYNDDPVAAADFRRFTEDSLLAGKRESLEIVRVAVRSLGSGAGKLTLAAADLDCWVRTLTDLRLVLGVRLGVEKADDLDDLDQAGADDPRRGIYEVFGWLGYLLDELLGALL